MFNPNNATGLPTVALLGCHTSGWFVHFTSLGEGRGGGGAFWNFLIYEFHAWTTSANRSQGLYIFKANMVKIESLLKYGSFWKLKAGLLGWKKQCERTLEEWKLREELVVKLVGACARTTHSLRHACTHTRPHTYPHTHTTSFHKHTCVGYLFDKYTITPVLHLLLVWSFINRLSNAATIYRLFWASETSMIIVYYLLRSSNCKMSCQCDFMRYLIDF